RRKAALCALLCCALLIGCSPLKTLPDPEPEVTATPSPSPAATPKPAPAEAPSGTEEEQREKTDKDKEETVYIKAGADGEAREVTVETVLRCRGTDGTIADRTRLTDIRNTEGDEDFRQGRNGSLIWENHGEDIHYEGKSRDPLPVGVKIRYTLNGRPIKPEDLAGKSGHLTIRFDYENRTQETREVSIYGGEAKTIQTRVPFLAVSFAMLPKEVFSHVECKNGRLLSLGEQNAFLGFALPGLPDALTLSDNKLTEELDIPTYAELEADVTDFEMDFTATVFSNGLLEDLEQKDLNDLYDLAGEFDTLYDAAAQLAEGSEKLGDGMSAYVGGVNSALQTAKDLTADLPAVAAELEALSKETGLQTSSLAESVSTLDSVRTSLSKVSGELEGLSGVLGGVSLSTEVIEAAAEAIEQAKNAVSGAETTANEHLSAMRGTARAAVQNARDALDAAEGALGVGLSAVNADPGGISIDLNDVMQEQGLSPEQMNAINGALQNQINGENGRLEESWSELVNTANDSITSAQQALNDASGALDAAKGPIDAAAGKLDLEGGVSLTDAYTALGEAQAAMTALAGTDPGELNTAIQALCREVDELKTITDTLYEVLTSHGAIQTYLEKVEKMTGSLDGKIPENFDPGSALQELMDAGTALNKGLHQLEDGTAAFRDGIAELAEDGGWKLRRLTRELDAMHAADLAYCNFGGIADGRSGSVRFVIETDAIEKQAK
ncbi:MAG: hypothetical protein VZQ75_09070, partial [Candidatus Faecousia sp.]|nr:hypothetical protein [Candidatus Faecousia sp.]